MLNILKLDLMYTVLTKLQSLNFEDMKSNLIFKLTLNNKKQNFSNDFLLYNSIFESINERK